MLRNTLMILLTITITLLTPAPGLAEGAQETSEPATKVLVNTDKNGLALRGYDPVAYFTNNEPAKGSKKHTSVYRGATYRFASAEHKAIFDADPEKYEPQFGGFCGYAASINKVSPINVRYFQIIDGRLILQHNRKAWDLWNQDVPGNIEKADQNWPQLEEKFGV